MRALALALSLLAAPASAECRVALSLALDVSSSVDAGEYRLQLEGLAGALEDGAVRAAIFQVPGATIALQVYEWSGRAQQALIADWAEIRTPADLDRLAASLRGHGRSFSGGSTGLGPALEFGRRQLGRAPDCTRDKIDVSGDGRGNDGIPPQQLYSRTDFGDITVNGLAIESDDAELGRYYRFFVMRGSGAFVEVARDFDDYAQAIRRKLIRELGEPMLGLK
ncbi:DUF1194 domain-containing protein [Halovulum dunhuangense]|uniref:DUF1194 domain-containing protein n=1 Tax=Halovulum dunhuangense TaxID=1505036 RepID=A0A849L624_9RHOB|nr:DUF1194 domain-containing protein [Halovulum dunhuangense]NNU81948.1 DUF1194 domain-containing protein [Halovulum dunhuangense]